MSKKGQTRAQTVGISRAVVLIVVVLGILQLAASSLLISSGMQEYEQEVKRATLNAANLDVFMLASSINRENDAQLGLLSLGAAPSAKEMLLLQQARKNTDASLKNVLLRLTQTTEPDIHIALQQLEERQQYLIQRRAEADKIMTRRPFVFDESSIFGWKLSISTWQDAIDKVLRLDTFHLADGADARLNRLTETKYQTWLLSRALGLEGNAMIVRAHFGRKLNSTEEYELQQSRDRAELIMESLRYGIDFLGDDTLHSALRGLAERTRNLNKAAAAQLAALDAGRALPHSVTDYGTIAYTINHDVSVFFTLLTDIAARDAIEQKQNDIRSLTLNIAFASLALALYAYFLLHMRTRIFRPLRHLQRVLDAAADAILTVDSERKIVVANQGATRMFGRSNDELRNLPIGELLIIDSQNSDWMEDELGLEDSLPGRGLCRDGSVFYAGISISHLPVKGGGRDRYLLIVRDENKRRIAEMSLARSMSLLSAIHRVESLLFARSPRQMVFREVLHILLDYFGVTNGIVLSLDSAKGKTAAFKVQARHGSEGAPAWVEHFCHLPQGEAIQLGQIHQMLPIDGWFFIPVQVDTRTVMVAGVGVPLISDEQYQALQPLLGACGSIVSFYSEEDRRRASERHLREVLQLEEAIYSASPIGLMHLDSDYNIIRANRAGEQLFGTGSNGLHGLALRELLAYDDEWAAFHAQLEKTRHDECYLSLESCCVTIGGRLVWVLFAGQLLFPGMVNDGMILACFDTTDRRVAEEGVLRARDAAAEARRQLELAIESLDEAFALFDGNDMLVLCNQHFARLTGTAAQAAALKGRSFASLLRAGIDAGERAEEGYDAEGWYQERLARYTQESSSFELRWNDIWLQQASRRVPDGGAVCILTDISALKRQQADLLLARDQANDASRAKSAFLAAMSHEIRTPMNGVLGMLELLSLTRLDAPQRDSVDTIQESAQTLLRLIDDILDFSKIEAGKLDIAPEPSSVAALMARVYHLYADVAESRQLSFKLEIDDHIAPALLVDPLRLRQILQNFCSNALKFTARGGVVLRVRVVASNERQQTLHFEVADTGIGIAAEQLASLFEPFTQAESTTARRFGGTGLGLTICHRLSELMGGDVTISSEPGQGTVAAMEISLPLCDPDTILVPPEDADLQLHLSQPLAQQQKLPVLFVEDNVTNRKLTLKQFEVLGYPVVSAEDGMAGLALWQSQAFAMILTDCHMPQMDGYELARTIRRLESEQELAPIPIVACTANAAKEEVEKTRAAGMDDFMTKPLGLATLKGMLEKWMPALSLAGNASAASSAPPSATEPDAALIYVPLDRSMLEIYSSGDWTIERAILDEFMQSNAEDIAVLAAAIASDDCPRIVWAAHRIKGASRMIGANDMGNAAEALEQAGKDAASNTVPALWHAFDKTHAELVAWLEEQP